MKNAARVEILERDGLMARFLVFDAEGRELYQCHRNIRGELVKADKKHEAIADMILLSEKKRKDI